MLSALLGDDANGDKLLDAARGLMDAFSDLLKRAQPEGGEVCPICSCQSGDPGPECHILGVKGIAYGSL